MTFSVPIDVSTPTGPESTKLGDDRIRETKVSIVEFLNVEHDASQTDNKVTGTAYHTQVHLPEQSSAPTAVADTGIVYSKDSGGVTELFFKDSGGNEVQLTIGGKIQGTSIADDSVDEDTIQLNNDASLNSVDNAGTGTVDLIKADTSDQVEFGANLAALTMAGAIAMGANEITGLDDGDADGDAVHFGQWKVDNVAAAAVGAATESVTFPNGLIIKHGVESVVSGASDTVTFAYPFPGGILNAWVSYQTTGADGNECVYVRSLTVNDMIVQQIGITGSQNVSWLAIGY